MALIWLLLPTLGWAAPRYVEVWFITPPSEQSSALDILLKRLFDPRETQVAQNETNWYECQPMGDGYCFHPQSGVLKMPGMKEVAPKKSEKNPIVKLKTFNALETDLVDCKKDYYFDIFCGKDSGPAKSDDFSLEIWVDTSASMKEVDRSEAGQNQQAVEQCYRKSFVKRLFSQCSADKILVSGFDTGKRSIDTFDSLCKSYGSNDPARLRQWIQDSQAKNLIIITDINEYNMELSDMIFSMGGVIRGVGKPEVVIYGKGLLNQLSVASKLCK